MKKDFAQLIKEMRMTFRPEFKTILDMNSGEQFDDALNQFEVKRDQMIKDNGYSVEEFENLSKEYFMDFSSENPDEWVIRHEPDLT